jgi:Cytochrome c7 and related cytochrome c
MKLLIVLATAGLYLSLLLVADPASTIAVSTAQEQASKAQPKDVLLAKDSQSDKYGEVAFSHTNHSTKNYSIDGKSVIGCVECHHTDQPKAALKPPLVTSERDVVLTAAVLEDAKSAPVKTCRACHLQAGDDSKPMPTVTYPGKTAPEKLNNEIAYHTNCNTCHDAAIKVRADLKGKIPGTNDCAKCHKPLE